MEGRPVEVVEDGDNSAVAAAVVVAVVVAAVVIAAAVVAVIISVVIFIMFVDVSLVVINSITTFPLVFLLPSSSI